MAEHTITIKYDDVACTYIVSAPTLAKEATGTTLQNALAWLSKIIRDPEEE